MTGVQVAEIIKKIQESTFVEGEDLKVIANILLQYTD